MGITLSVLSACQSPMPTENFRQPVSSSGTALQNQPEIDMPNEETPQNTDSLEVAKAAAEPIAITAQSGAIVMGHPDAPLTLIMYDDYGCIYCREFGTTDLPWLLQTYVLQGQLVIERVMMPMTTAGTLMATVAVCSRNQDRFTETDHALHASPISTDAQIPTLAATVGLNVKALRTCMASETTTSFLQAATDRATAASITRLPAFQLGSNRWIGIETQETLQRAMDDAR